MRAHTCARTYVPAHARTYRRAEVDVAHLGATRREAAGGASVDDEIGGQLGDGGVRGERCGDGAHGGHTVRGVGAVDRHVHARPAHLAREHLRGIGVAVGGWVGGGTGRRANVCARARAKVRVSTWCEHVPFPCPRARARRACARASTHARDWRRALTLAGVMGSLTDAFSASPSAATKGAASWSIAITKSTVLMGYGRMCARAGGGARARVSTCVCAIESPARWRWPARSARCAHA